MSEWFPVNVGSIETRLCNVSMVNGVDREVNVKSAGVMAGVAECEWWQV